MAQVVGECDGARSLLFVYREGQTWNLNRLLDPNSGRDWVLVSARGVNDTGQIVGSGQFNHGPLRAVLLTPMPISHSSPK